MARRIERDEEQHRIKNDGHLHRLKRWPAALDKD